MTVGVFLTTMEDHNYTIFDSIFNAIDYTREQGNFLMIRIIQWGEKQTLVTPLKADKYQQGVQTIAKVYVQVIKDVLRDLKPYNLVTAGKPKLDNVLFNFTGFEVSDVNQHYIDKLMMGSASNTLSLKERELFLQTSFLKKYFNDDEWFTALTNQLE